MNKIKTMAQIGFLDSLEQAERLVIRVLVPITTMNATKPEKINQLKNISTELGKLFNELRKIISETL